MSIPRDARPTSAPSGTSPAQLRDNHLVPLVAIAACGAVVPMLGTVGFGDFTADPSSPTAWILFALGAPTLVLLILKDPAAELSRVLQILWSLAFIAYLAHALSSADPAHQTSLFTRQLLGIPLSAILLAMMWAVTVWSAWRWPAVIWPQAAILFVLAGWAIAMTIQCSGLVQRICGISLMVALAVAVVLRMRKLFKQITEIKRPSPNLCPTPPDITPLVLAQQAWRDLNGKEVQSAATYSYLWFADQVGHFGLGMLLSLGIGEIVYDIISWQELANLLHFTAHTGSIAHGVAHFVGFLIATAGVCYWEFNSYRSSIAVANGPFPIDKQLLFDNAVIAATYMVIGTVAGWAFRLDLCHRVPMFFALAFLAVGAAKPWIRQKIIWQKAGLPYLFRLAEAQHDVHEADATVLQEMVEAAAPPHAPPRQVVLAGPLGSGRTLLACGIGTELAFCNKTVRYVSLDRLIEFATDPRAVSIPPHFGDDSGPKNIDYWPWTEAQVLVIDDIGPVLGVTQEQGAKRPTVSGMTQEGDLKTLLNTKLKPLHGCIKLQHTVWIVGDLGSGNVGQQKLRRYGELIQDFCEGSHPPTLVLLSPPRGHREGHPPIGRRI